MKSNPPYWKQPFTCITRVEAGNSDGCIRLYPAIHAPFMTLMGRLYPRFAAYDKAEVGYSAFAPDGRFIGCFAGMTLQSVRKNPWLIDKDQLFLKALCAGLVVAGHSRHSSVCDPENYGTLSLWKRLGLGAKLDKRGKARSDGRSPESEELLNTLMDKARPGYAEVRKQAQSRLAEINAQGMLSLLPNEAEFKRRGLICYRVRIED